jgi:CheY-like chemotaxis protein
VSLEQYEIIYNNINNSIFLIGLEAADVCRIVSANAAYLRCNKVQPEAMIGKLVSEYYTSAGVLALPSRSPCHLRQLVGSGAEALVLIAKDSFSMVVTGLDMPEMNGFESAKESARLINRSRLWIWIKVPSVSMKSLASPFVSEPSKQC